MLKPGRKRLAILAVPLIFLGIFATRIPGAQAATTADRIAGFGTTECIVQGSGTSVYVNGSCAPASSLNHAGLWEEILQTDGTGSYELKNVHSGLCLSVDGTSDPYVDTCTGNHAQDWVITLLSGGGYRLRNVHTNLYLRWSPGSDVLVQGSITGPDAIWGLTPASV